MNKWLRALLQTAGVMAAFTLAGETGAATVFTAREQTQYSDIGTLFSTDVDGGSVALSVLPFNQVRINILTSNPLNDRELSIAAPDEAPLAPGRYDNTSQSGIPGRPQLDYVHGSGCSTGGPGYFIVHEFQWPSGPDGQAHVAIDYLHRCGLFFDIDRPRNTMGSIRINSDVPVSDFPPWADGGADIYGEEGQTLGLGAEPSYPGSALITEFHYRQLSGPPVTVPPSGGFTFTAPSVPISGGDLSFELTVTNALGLSATDVVDVHVDSLQGRRTFIEMRGDMDNYLSPFDRRLERFQNGAYAQFLYSGTVIPGQSRIEFLPFPRGLPWFFEFLAPDGQPMVLDNYEQAIGAGSPTRPKIHINGGGRGCNVESGRFVVLEYDYDEVAQRLISAAIDFEHHCENAPSKLLGWIRMNSAVPVVREVPDAAAGADQFVEIGEHVDLDARNSLPGNGTIVTWQWQQISGTPVTLAGGNQSLASFTAPTVPNQGDSLVFEVTVTNDLGRSDSDRVTVFVRGIDQVRNYLRITGDPTDPITDGLSFDYDPAEATLSLAPGPYDRRFIDLRHGSAESWMLRFAAPSGREFEVGTYTHVTSFVFPTPTKAGVSVDGRGTGCDTADGTLTILELSFDPVTNAVTRLAAEFEQRCEGFTGFLRGSVRFNSALPVPFTGLIANAGPDLRVEERQPALLDGRATIAGSGSISSYRWTQISGPAVILRNATAAVAGFDAPSVTSGGQTLEFELQATDTLGHTETDRVRVAVLDRGRVQTMVHLESDVGDWIGQGDTIDLRPEEFNYRTNANPNGSGLQQFFDSMDSWSLWFASGSTTPLQVGAYPNAVGSPGSGAPIVAVDGRGRGCGSREGSFDVREIAFAQSGAIERLVLHFVQRCDGSAAELRGTVVYQSPLPDAHAGTDSTADNGDNVSLNASASSSAVGNIVSYQWRQLSGPSVTLFGATSLTATFTAPRITGANAALLTFELEVTDDRGLTSTDAVQVTVRPVVAPPPGGGGGGGGGAFGLLFIALLFGLHLYARHLPRTAGFL